MRHVKQQAGVHHQFYLHAILGHGRLITHRSKLRDTVGSQDALCLKSGDDFLRGAQMRFTGLAVNHDRIASSGSIGDAFNRADQRHAHSARYNGDMGS